MSISFSGVLRLKLVLKDKPLSMQDHVKGVEPELTLSSAIDSATSTLLTSSSLIVFSVSEQHGRNQLY